MIPALPLITLAFAAVGCLCLAMERHALQLGANSRLVQKRNWLRRSGWLLLALATMVSVITGGWGFGLVALLGSLSAVTLAVIGLMTYRPRWLIYSTGACGIAGLLMSGPVIWPGI
ncbi:DUF3325 domain-containing protein [Microbulbifer taiwanensis]|uniref:DUF3325 domain-containing protein n=1 Tax=Microbulbifer taiwanensis TaxID=986746 RepID=A0ABW1YM90_9GAMM|nr:DUF3325 domain-containing protein [Microbulbifer taiwanensis]